MEGVSRLSATEFWTEFVQSRVTHIQRISRRDRPNKEFVQVRQMLDDEVAAMHLALCSLRTHRNTLSPIATLPMELLARILKLHAVDQPPSEPDLGWIRTTHVCRFWRDTALSHPTLWGNVTTELGPRWLELMLDRAKSVPLSCQLHHERYNRHFLAHILPRLFHIRRLSVLLETPDTIDVTAHSLTAPAPMLDTLDLMANYQCHHRTILPEEIFENESPMLRRLSLKNISVSWSASVLHGLTYLHLEQGGRDRCPFSREDDFFCALNGMPTLQTLYLENVLPGGSHADDQTARLLCLQNLTIIDGGYRCLDILPKLNIPSSCRIGIHCVEFGSEDPELPDGILPLRLCEHVPATTDPFYTVSLVHDSSKRYCGLKLWRKSNISDSTVLYPPRDPDLSLIIDRRWPEELLAIMFDTLPLNDIRVIIRRDYQYGLAGDDWDNIFAHRFDEVSGILMNRALDAEGLCKVLTMTLDDTMIPEEEAQHILFTRSRFLFPNLRLLELQSIDVRPTMTTSNRITEVGDSMVKALNIRRTGGRPLSLVRLGTGCIIDAARLNALREIVDVEWDPDAVQEIPEAREGRPEGFVHICRW